MELATIEEIIEMLRSNVAQDTDSLIKSFGLNDFERGVQAGILTCVSILENMLINGDSNE